MLATRVWQEVTGGWDDSTAVARFEGRGGRLVRGYGRITGPCTVAVGDDRFTARRGVVLATGSQPLIPPIPGLADVDHWTTHDAIAGREVAGIGDRARRRDGGLRALFRTFAHRLVEIGAYLVCNCEACHVAGDLKLKIVAHSGEALFTQVGQYPTLSGPDVITLHRLSKNSVREQQYFLMTETAYHDLGEPGGSGVIEGTELLDTGTFTTYTIIPQVTVRDDPAFIRSQFSDDNAAVQILRDEVSREYTDVAHDPERGYHFNTGRVGAGDQRVRRGVAGGTVRGMIASLAGTGNPFAMGMPAEGEYVVDVGSGAGLDALIAAQAVGPAGHVIGVEMT